MSDNQTAMLRMIQLSLQSFRSGNHRFKKRMNILHLDGNILHSFKLKSDITHRYINIPIIPFNIMIYQSLMEKGIPNNFITIRSSPRNNSRTDTHTFFNTIENQGTRNNRSRPCTTSCRSKGFQPYQTRFH